MRSNYKDFSYIIKIEIVLITPTVGTISLSKIYKRRELNMNIRQEAKEYLGVEIDSNVGKILGKSILSKRSTGKMVYGFALTAIHLGFDPKPYLQQRLGEKEANLMVESIYDDMAFEEELSRNILYIACVWAEQAKRQVEGKQQRHQEKAHKVIDYVASLCVRHWTLEPIVNQSGVDDVEQRLVSTVLRFLVKKDVLCVVKQGGRGTKKSNIYGIKNNRDLSPEEIKKAFTNLSAKNNISESNVLQYLGEESEALNW
jgi:hypothetical protein